jgi:hypothetical protein
MRLEKQEAIRKQEQNSAALKIYFRAMNLSIHKREEDFNASMSILSIYHLELHENFTYYAQPFKGPYSRIENELIPLQGLFNFCKVMRLATRSSEVLKYYQMTLKDIEGVNAPPDDTLNVRNGLNYAQFLEAILRICIFKADMSGAKGEYKRVLEDLFKGSEKRDDFSTRTVRKDFDMN